MHHTPKKTYCIDCISITKTASRLQKWHLGYKKCVSFTNIYLLDYKFAFRLTKLHLGLQLSEINYLLSKLSPEQKEAVILRYGEQLSFGEIAKVTGCNMRTVQSRVRNALKIMRKEQKNEG